MMGGDRLGVGQWAGQVTHSPTHPSLGGDGHDMFHDRASKKEKGTDSPVRAGWAGPHLLHELLANSLLKP